MGTPKSLTAFLNNISEVMHFRSQEYKWVYPSTYNMWKSLFDITSQIKQAINENK